MKHTIRATAAAVLATLPLLAAAQAKPEPEFTFTGNFQLSSEYIYRGIAQTNRKPAVSGGFDFAHKSGFYLGNWNSSISWLSDANAGLSAPIEMDFYGGFKFSPVDDLTLDLGFLRYEYPTKGVSLAVKPDTTEIYLGASYGPVTFKYSRSTTALFGTAASKGSTYLDLTGNFELAKGLVLTPHIGKQTVKTGGATALCADNSKDYTYTDYSVKLAYDLDGWIVSGMYVDTNAKKACYTGVVGGTDLGAGRLVVSIGKSF
jgi:uncharacterized protein (TIGR02001 family)